MPRILKIEIQTSKTDEDEAYVHELHPETDLQDVIHAIQTWYGEEEVSQILIYIEDKADIEG